MMDKVPKKNVSFNYSHGLFSLLSTLFNAGLGLAPHGLVQSDLVRHGPIRDFTCNFKMNSHI